MLFFVMFKRNSENYVKYPPLGVFCSIIFGPSLWLGPLLIFKNLFE
jgi:hypothetical protein